MSVYRNKVTGERETVCDGCGISTLGIKLDPNEWEKVDLTAEMMRAGFPEGTALDVMDSCPDCRYPSQQEAGA